MGIKPSGDNPIIVPPDNIQSRWGEWEADLDSAGQVAGEVNLETWTLANSANEWVSQNSSKVEGLLTESQAISDALKGEQQEQYTLLNELSALNTNFDQNVEQALSQSEKIEGLTQDLGKKVDSGSALITDLTDLNSNFDTKVSETGSVSDLQDDYRTLNTRLWGQQGIVNEDNVQQWEDQGILNSMQMEMWSDQGKVNELNELLWEQQGTIDTLQTERADLHAQMIELNRGDIDRQDEFISRFLSSPGFEPFSDDYFSVTKVGTQWRVEALGAWTGRYTLQSAWMNNGNWEPVINVENVPSDDPTNPRVKYINGAEYSTIINYWVRNSIHETDDKATGSYTTGAWTTRSELTFPAPINADYSVYYQVVWGAATYDDTYSFRIQCNGTTIMQWGPMTHVGPISFLDSGVRTRTLSDFAVPLKSDDVLTFQTYSNAGTTSQRSVRSSQRKISWMVPANDPSMATTLSTTGDGGFTPNQETQQNIEWNWQNSIRFLDHDVTADRTVSVHSYDTGLYTPVSPGTTITSPTYIRTVEPHPDRVTFTRKS